MTGNHPAPLLRVQDLRIETGNGAALVSGVSFSVRQGERLAVVGPSGAGKSLLAHAIARVLRPPLRVAAGEIEFAESHGIPGRTAFLMFQNPGAALNPCLRIRAQLGRIAALAGRTPVNASVDAALTMSGLSAADADLYAFQMSGGMKQRVVFAAAFLQRPALLIADEVATGLDPLSRREFCLSLESLLAQSGSALMFISHDLGLASEICPRALVLAGGRSVACGSWGVLAEQHPAARALVSAARSLGEPLC